MKKSVGVLLLVGMLAVNFWASSAQALPAFKKAFEKRYVENSTSDDFKAAEKTASCNVCHIKDHPKTERNAYGKALSHFTGGHVAKDMKAAKDAGDEAKAKELMDKAVKALDHAFDETEGKKSPSGPTYGELLKAGKLPAGK